MSGKTIAFVIAAFLLPAALFYVGAAFTMWTWNAGAWPADLRGFGAIMSLITGVMLAGAALAEASGR